MIHAVLMIGLLAFPSPAPGGSAGQYVCNAPTANEWLKQGPAVGTSGFTEVDRARVLAVSADLEAATAMLATVDAIEITPQQAQRFSGQSDLPDGTPYLARAVFPTPRPMVIVNWYGADLYVFAGGLGCAPYEKHPVVVFLDQRPERVFVSASAAL